MARALLFISLFLITLIGGLLLRPDPVHSLKDYESPDAIESRKQVTRRMAEFLVQNPKIVEQEKLTTLPLSPSAPALSSGPLREESNAPGIQIHFQNSELEFKNQNEFNAWMFLAIKSSGNQFLKNIDFGDQIELALSTLHKVAEVDPSPEIIAQVKQEYLNRAKTLIQNTDGFSQQMTSRALQEYLNLESDKELGKRTVDAILQSNNKQPESP